MRDINDIIVHCAYTKPSMDVGADEIRQWHLDRGWSDIGYNYVIRRNGLIENGRDLDKDGNVDEEVGAHTLGHNKGSIGICLVGGMNEDGKPDFNFTWTQLQSLRNLVQNLRTLYNCPVHGHRDYSDKPCPCFDVHSFFKGV